MKKAKKTIHRMAPRLSAKNSSSKTATANISNTTSLAHAYQRDLVVRHKGDRVSAAAPRDALAVAVIENVLERNQAAAQLLRGRPLVVVVIIGIGIVHSRVAAAV